MSYSFPTNQPDGTEVTLANGVTYQYDQANDRWMVKSVPGGDVNLDDLLWQEIDTGSNQNPPLRLQITHPTRPTGSSTESIFTLWHGDPADATTAPEQEFKVWMRDGGKSIIDKYNEDGIVPEFEIRQGDKKMYMKCNPTYNGGEAGWTTNTTTYHCGCNEVSGDILVDGPCEWYVRYEFDINELDKRYVKKEGGDEMQGPFVIKNNPDNGDSSRENRRLTVLDIKSGTDQSSLNLGALNTSVYVGANQTTFAKPIHVNDVKEKDDGRGVTFASTIKFDSALDTVLAINPDVDSPQKIDLFGGGGNKILNVNLQGATYQSAIEFESGPSQGKDIIFRLDSNKGIKAKDLSAWDTNIKDLADPVDDKDAVNKRYFENTVRDKLDSLIVENSSGAMTWGVFQVPPEGQFSTYTANGGQTTYDPATTREIWAHNTNRSGYAFGWDQLQPNNYIYMSGPNSQIVRFRIVAESEDQGTWSKIKVADGFTSPDGYTYNNGDTFDVVFRNFSGGNVDLDDYLPIDGSKPMTGELQAYHKVKAVIPNDGTEFETAIVLVEGYRSSATADAARITMSNGYNANSYATINYRGTSGSNGILEFDRARVDFKRLGNSRDGLVIRGRTDAGGTWGNNNALLSAFHNQGTGSNADAVNYYGKQDATTNLATVGFVSSLFGGESVIAPYGPMEPIANGRVPAAGQISFGSTKPSETASIAISKTDKDGNENDYHYGVDSIFSVVVDGVIVSGGDDFPMKQLISVRVDGIEDKGSYIVLTVDGRDVHCKQRDETTGQYFYNMDPLVWYFNYEDTITPMQKVPASLDEMFQFRDETAVFPEYLKYTLSTDSGDGLLGANSGYLYMQGSLTAPSNLRLCTKDRYGYGYLAKADKSTATFTVNVPGEMTMFTHSKWSKALIPVEGFYFDSLYFNQNKDSIRLQNWDRSWKNTYHDWSAGEVVYIKFDFMAKAHGTRMLEQELEEMKTRLAALECK